MDVLSNVLAAFASAFNQDERLFTLHFSDASLDAELLPHTIVAHEHISAPYVFDIECLSSDTSLPLKTFIGCGVDIAVQLGDGSERVVSGVVTASQQLGSDGGFARYGLTVEPAYSALKLRRNSRVFQDKSVVDIVGLILEEHIQNNPVFAQCFRHREQLTQDYPTRSYCQQYRESDFAFIERLLREEGISYYFDFEHGSDEIGLHTLVLFDAGSELNPAAQSSIRFHRADQTEADDTITQWQAHRQIQPGAAQLASYDYKGVYAQQGSGNSAVDHGETGSGLTAGLEDYDPQSLYYGSDNSDLNRYAQLRQQSYDLRAKTFAGEGVVRGLGAGQTFALTQHPNHDGDNEFVVLSHTFSARNNLPGEFDQHPITQSLSSNTRDEPGYQNSFQAVRKHIPIVPEYAHTEHAKPTIRGTQTATVVGPQGEEIYTDELGRIKIQFHWAREQDHDTGIHGAGANKDDFSSCWVRVGYPSAGANWGHQFIPRIGQEVLVNFIEGDIDRPIVMGALYNGQQNPPTFQNAGSLPANKTLSGIKTHEYKGSRHNELVFDDTTGEIRTTLSTEHGKTQLNQGFLIHPRTEGKGEQRGEGFELRTDNAGAIRAAQGLLITTEAQPNAAGNQLQRNSVQAQLDAAANLTDALGETAKAQNANLPESGKSNKTVNIDSQSGSAKTEGHLHHLKDATRNIERNTNTDAQAKSGTGDQAGQQPLLIAHGEAGVSLTTPQSTTIATGNNFDQIAQRDTHQSTGKRWIHNVGESVSLFVAGAQNKLKESLKILAAKGNVQIQAQSADIEITADKAIRLHALKQKQTWSAQKEILITCGGAYVRIGGGNIELHCPGTLTFKGSQHAVTGPASKATSFPVMPTLSGGEQWAKAQYVHPAGEPVFGQFRATDANGKVTMGTLNAKGEALVSGVASGNVNIELVTPK
ncbi:MAG: type VI secretion system tip protein TssI/VgrG [Spongiibacteraceae bacterium]